MARAASLARIVAGGLLLAALLAALLTGCGAPAGSPVELPDGAAARRWGDGAYGVVLVHDARHTASGWDAPARVFADRGMTVLAVEDASAGAIEAAIRSLRATGVDRVALLAAAEGAGPALDLARAQPGLVDQLILLSARAEVAGLGAFPKLFVASEGEEAAPDARRMAAEAAGDWNALFLAPGAASGQSLFGGEGGDETLDAVLRRLEERR